MVAGENLIDISAEKGNCVVVNRMRLQAIRRNVFRAAENTPKDLLKRLWAIEIHQNSITVCTL